MGENLADRLHADMIAAMKAREKAKLQVLRMLNAAIKDATIAKRTKPERGAGQASLSDDEVLKLLMGYAKKREEAKREAEKANRPDLAEKEAFELEVVKSYLPQALSEEELVRLVEEVIEEIQATSMKDMGAVMKACQARAGGRADGSRISAVVRTRLGG